MGADGVELDVKISADGVLMVHHDADLARTAGRPDLLADLPAAELPDFIPTLESVLDELRSLTINIELKNSASDADFDETARVADLTAELLARRHGDQVIISSFHLPTLDRFHALAPTVPTGLLQLPGIEVEASVLVATERGHTAIHPMHPVVDAAYVAAVHQAGLAINVWTVDDPERIRSLAALGVDGIVTNVPDVAIAALDR